MEIQRKCQWCGKPFIAHTMVTRYCSKSCNEKAYKEKKRKQRLQEYEERQNEQPMQEVGIVGSKLYLSPAETATLLGISRATIYRHMATGIIRALQLRGRTIIRKSDIEKMFDDAPGYKKRSYGRKQTVLYYTTNEILEKYQIQKKTLYRRCKLYNIPKVEEGNRVFYNRTLIDKYFADLTEEINPNCYYTPEQVMEKYGMSRNAVVTFALRHNIPRINRHHKVYYSRAHIDAIKEKQDKLNPDYYTYAEITEKYGLSKINISYYVNKYDIKRFKQGSRTMVLRSEFDKVYIEHRDGTYTPKKREKKSDLPKETFVIPEGYYSSEQIAATYHMNRKTICKLCRENDIPKISHSGFNYYKQLSVDRFFAKYKAADNIKEWISAEQMEEIYGMSKDARCSFVHRHKIPSRVVYGKVQYSKDHIDIIKSGGFDQREMYYSVAEAMEKYSLRRDDVYNYVRYNKIRKMHHGKSMFLLKEDFDKVMAEKSGI